MASPEDDPTRSPDDPGESGGLGDMGADLQAALGDLLGGEEGADEDAGTPDDDLDLNALEDAVAELGIDIVDDGPDEAPPARPSPGLDLTERPAAATPPRPPGADPEPPARKLPPLGQASADDLFGPLDDDWDDGGGATDFTEPSGPDLQDLPPPPSGDASYDEPGPEPEPIPVSVPEPPAATPTSDEIVAYAAHRGRITGEIAAKARKLFGR